MRLKPTIALEKGDARIWQCANCGTLIYATTSEKLKGIWEERFEASYGA